MQRTPGPSTPVYQHPFEPMEGETHQSIDLDATVYTLNVPAGARTVMVQTTAQNVAYTLDGSAPTATNGFIMVANDVPVVFYLDNDITLRFIELAGGAILQFMFGT